MAEGLAGKATLVTGGASGIGRATALAFAKEGAPIVIADVDVVGGEETSHLITTTGGEARFIRADVSQAADVEALIGKAVEAYGRLDCAFNNAGIYSTSPIVGTTEEEWERVIRTNLIGVWLCMKYELPQMLAQGRGAIVNSSSMVGLVAGSGAAYTASKHGVVGLTKSAAVAYAPRGIRVNAVAPASSGRRNVERAMRRLESHVENYLVRAYELRERALGLLASCTHRAKDVEKLRHPKQRPDALSRLKSVDQALTAAVEHLLSLLDDDIGLRNLHTHHFYLSLGLYTGSDIFEPYDALLDLSNKPASRRKLEALLRREIKKTAQRYVDKVEALLEAVRKVLEAGDSVTRVFANGGLPRE